MTSQAFRVALVGVSLAMIVGVASCGDPSSTTSTPTSTSSSPADATTSTMSSMSGMDHSGSTSSEHRHGEAVSTDVAADLTAAGYMENGQSGTWDFVGAASTAPNIAGPEFAAAANATVASRGWSNLATAEADGFSQPTKYTDPLHWWNEDYVNDGITGDPTKPESLVFDPRNGKFLATMWLMPIGEHGPAVTGIDAADGRWHVHPGSLCYREDKMIPWDQMSKDGTCPDGMTAAPWSAEMLHVWVAGDKPFTSKMPDEAAEALEEINKRPSNK